MSVRGHKSAALVVRVVDKLDEAVGCGGVDGLSASLPLFLVLGSSKERLGDRGDEDRDELRGDGASENTEGRCGMSIA